MPLHLLLPHEPRQRPARLLSVAEAVVADGAEDRGARADVKGEGEGGEEVHGPEQADHERWAVGRRGSQSEGAAGSVRSVRHAGPRAVEGASRTRESL